MSFISNKNLFAYKKLKKTIQKPRNRLKLWLSYIHRIVNIVTSITCLLLYCLIIITAYFFHSLPGFFQGLPEIPDEKFEYRPNFLVNPIPKNCHGNLCGIYVTSNFTSIKNKTIIVITPTNKRLERIPDLTRFSQTLMHISNVHWIVIEDGIETVDAVDRLLNRTKIPYAYFFAARQRDLPAKGWTQRNDALAYLRKYYNRFEGDAIVYFADDDNTYDIRLFNNFVKNVKKVGVWPVGIVGGAVVEGPIVKNQKVVDWKTVYKPNRTFAIDMAGFAVNLDLILATNANFGFQCIKEAPEDCLLIQLGIKRNELEPFGYKNNYKDVLVWHTKTAKSNVINNNNNDFDMEISE